MGGRSGGRGSGGPGFGGRGNSADRKAGRRNAQLQKVDAKGKAEADFYFKLRAEEMGRNQSNRTQSKDQIRRDRDELFDKSHGSSGIRFDEYEEVPVTRSGPGAEPKGPPALTSFNDLTDTKLSIPKFLLENIKRCGYNKPTPIQAHCVPLALDNGKNDLMSCAQTGSGKTCAFLLPVIARLDVARGGSGGSVAGNAAATTGDTSKYAATPAVVVMAPTRELAIQIHHEARRLVFDDDMNKTPPRAVVVYGGADAKGQLRELTKGVDILVATPGRLQDFVDRGVVSFRETKHLILDEADRMLDMGFEPQIRKLVLQRDMPAKHNRQTLMFSATFPESIQNLAKEFLRNGYTWVGVGRVGSTVNAITQNFELASVWIFFLCGGVGGGGSGRATTDFISMDHTLLPEIGHKVGSQLILGHRWMRMLRRWGPRCGTERPTRVDIVQRSDRHEVEYSEIPTGEH